MPSVLVVSQGWLVPLRCGVRHGVDLMTLSVFLDIGKLHSHYLMSSTC